MRVVMGPGSCYTILHNNVHVCMILFIKETVTNEIEKKLEMENIFHKLFILRALDSICNHAFTLSWFFFIYSITGIV